MPRPLQKHLISAMIAGAIAAPSFAATPPFGAKEPTPYQGRVSVIDGDTLEMRGDRIRLFGIDAPEGQQTCTDREHKVWRCGQRAALAFSDFIAGRMVACEEIGRRDRYARLVARCAVLDVQSDRYIDLNTWMVSMGWALDYPAYSHGAYSGAEQAAKAAHRGVWVGTVQAPWEWRKAKRAR